MLNVAVLMGRLVATPELRHTQSDIPVCSFRIAVDRNFSGKSGERQADFIDIVAWRNTALFVSKYFQKGQMIAVNGSIQTRSYEDKQGNKRTAVEVVADNVSFCGSKKESGGYQPDESYGGYGNGGFQDPAPDPMPSEPAPAFTSGDADGFDDLLDGDLPF